MASIDIFDQKQKKVGSQDLGPGWSAPVRKGSVYETALWQLNGRRAGTASTKQRSEIKGSGRKIYRQKGTGNARHGARSAPIFVGGGIVGGPRPRDWSYPIPKKERGRAIQSILIQKLRDDRLKIVDDIDFGEIKTKKAREFFTKWKLDSALVVLDKRSDNVIKSIRNIPYCKACSAESLNVVDLLKHDFIVLTKAALEKVEKNWVQRV